MTLRSAALGACLTVGALLFAQQSPTFHTEVNLVNVTALVRSADGTLLTDLKKDDFQVLEDGVEQHVQFFAREKEIPLDLALVVDVSGSQDKFLEQHNRDVEQFLTTVLSPTDRATAICFGNHLRLVSDRTSSVDQIMDGLRRFSKGDRHFPEIGPKEERELGTALYDALYFATKEKLTAADESRKAIVLFSDGEENSSEHDLLDAIEEAQNQDVLIYCIRYTNTGHAAKVPKWVAKRLDLDSDRDSEGLNARNKYGIRVMRHLANLTGAADFNAVEVNLPDVFSQIGNELRSLYSIGYLSTNTQRDGSFRKLTIRCKVPNSVVRAKSGYYAK